MSDDGERRRAYFRIKTTNSAAGGFIYFGCLWVVILTVVAIILGLVKLISWLWGL